MADKGKTLPELAETTTPGSASLAVPPVDHTREVSERMSDLEDDLDEAVLGHQMPPLTSSQPEAASSVGHEQRPSRDADVEDDEDDSDAASDTTIPVPADLLRSSPIEARDGDDEDEDSGDETDGTLGRTARDPALQGLAPTSRSEANSSDDEDSDDEFTGSVIHPDVERALREAQARQSQVLPADAEEEVSDDGLESAPVEESGRPVSNSGQGAATLASGRIAVAQVPKLDAIDEGEEEDAPAPLRPSAKGKGPKTEADRVEEDAEFARRVAEGLDSRDREIEFPEGAESESEEERPKPKRKPDTSNDAVIAAVAQQQEFDEDPKAARKMPTVAGPSVPTHLKGLETDLSKEEGSEKDESEGPLDSDLGHVITEEETSPAVILDDDVGIVPVSFIPPKEPRTPFVSSLEQEGLPSLKGKERERREPLDFNLTPRREEEARPNRPAYLLQWLNSTTHINPGLIAALAVSPAQQNLAIEAMRAQAEEDAIARLPHYERSMDDIRASQGQGYRIPGTSMRTPTWADTAYWGGSEWRSNTARLDAKHSGEFRDMLQNFEVSIRPDGTGPQVNHLDLVKETFSGLKDKINQLQGGDPDFDFAKTKAIADIDALLYAVGATAYDKEDINRWGTVATVAGTLAIGALPFAYAYYTEPTSYFYLGGLAGAYARTLMLAIGLMSAGAATGAMIKEHVKERQAIWALPGAFYSVQAYIIAVASDHSDNETLHDLAENVKKFEKPSLAGIGFLIFVGVAEMLIFLALNHPAKASSAWTATKSFGRETVLRRDPSAEAKFGRGQLTPDNTPENQALAVEIRNELKLGSRLLETFAVASAKWEQGDWSDDEKAALQRARVAGALSKTETASLQKARAGEVLSEVERAGLWSALRKASAGEAASGNVLSDDEKAALQKARAAEELTDGERAHLRSALESAGIREALSDEDKALLVHAKSKGDNLSAAEKAVLTEVRQSLGELSDTLEVVVGGIKAQLEQISEKEKKQKQQAGRTLLITGAILGAVSSAAALRVPALLTDYIPYYVTTELLLLAKMRDDTLQAADVARTFGSYYGGTFLGMPPSIMNLLSLFFGGLSVEGGKFLGGDGFFDIVSPSDTEVTRHPNTAIPVTRNIHGADGKINFSVFVIYSVLSILWVGGRVGAAISDSVIEKMEQAALGEVDENADPRLQEIVQHADRGAIRKAIDMFRNARRNVAQQEANRRIAAAATEDTGRFEEVPVVPLDEDDLGTRAFERNAFGEGFDLGDYMLNELNRPVVKPKEEVPAKIPSSSVPKETKAPEERAPNLLGAIGVGAIGGSEIDIAGEGMSILNDPRNYDTNLDPVTEIDPSKVASSSKTRDKS